MADQDVSPTDTMRAVLTTPPAEFVAERNRVAKAVKADGDKDTARLIAALRRPSVADWMLNVLAGDAPDEIAAFAAAAIEVQEAQAAAIEGRPTGDIREAMRGLRERAAAIVALARTLAGQPGVPVAGSSVGELTGRLTEIAATAASTELLRHGLLGAADAGGGDPLAGLDLSAPPKRGDKTAKRAATASATKPAVAKRARGRDEAAAAKATKEAEEARAAERRAHVRALADAERARDRAEKSLARADGDVERMEAALAKAQAVVDDAQAKLDTTQAHLDDAEAKRASLADALADAEGVVSAARQAVDADR